MTKQTENTTTENTTMDDGLKTVEQKAPKAPKVQNLVKLDDGSVVDFGSRKVISVLEGNKYSFKLVNGRIITWEVPFIEALENASDFVKAVYFYGAGTKVKSALSPCKTIEDVEAEINKQITAFNAGTFVTRQSDSSTIGLTLWQKAYAKAKSVQDGFATWANFNDTDIVKHILEVWSNLTKEQISAIKKNPWVKVELAILEQEASKEFLDLI